MFSATPLNVPLVNSQVSYLSEHLSGGFMQPGPGLELGPLDPESSTLTVRSPRLSQKGYASLIPAVNFIPRSVI